MGQYDSDRTVVMIKTRLKQLAIDLERYLGSITNKWDSTPAGFGFTCADQKAYLGLMDALVQNPNFGSDNMVAGSQHIGASFRECGKSDSLHVVLSNRADKVSGATCSVHLDSVSVATSVDRRSGMVNYDYGKVLQHVATDLLHTPLIMPGSEKGIVFGFRF
jgi:hypothetical protein